MEISIGSCKLDLALGDITQQSTDAIVNAANSHLAGGGGVDGAIHRGGGPSIMAETREKYPQGCPTGEAVITGAGALPARYVIHTVGPIWSGGGQGEPDLLTSAYRRSLEVAVDNGCQSVAFPSLSTGAYGYPLEQAARTALGAVIAFLRERQQPAQVRFVLFDQVALDAFGRALASLTSPGGCMD
jgi:O-acetyl-ADP-ribose deacetylase (regulator of RNase III)